MSRITIYKNKKVFLTLRGYVIKIEMKLYRYTQPMSVEYPEGYQFSLIAFNVDKPQQELVLFDNHHGKRTTLSFGSR